MKREEGIFTFGVGETVLLFNISVHLFVPVVWSYCNVYNVYYLIIMLLYAQTIDSLHFMSDCHTDSSSVIISKYASKCVPTGFPLRGYRRSPENVLSLNANRRTIIKRVNFSTFTL